MMGSLFLWWAEPFSHFLDSSHHMTAKDALSFSFHINVLVFGEFQQNPSKVYHHLLSPSWIASTSLNRHLCYSHDCHSFNTGNLFSTLLFLSSVDRSPPFFILPYLASRCCFVLLRRLMFLDLSFNHFSVGELPSVVCIKMPIACGWYNYSLDSLIFIWNHCENAT